jgi:hypothetical protein
MRRVEYFVTSRNLSSVSGKSFTTVHEPIFPKKCVYCGSGQVVEFLQEEYPYSFDIGHQSLMEASEAGAGGIGHSGFFAGFEIHNQQSGGWLGRKWWAFLKFRVKVPYCRIHWQAKYPELSADYLKTSIVPWGNGWRIGGLGFRAKLHQTRQSLNFHDISSASDFIKTMFEFTNDKYATEFVKANISSPHPISNECADAQGARVSVTCGKGTELIDSGLDESHRITVDDIHPLSESTQDAVLDRLSFLVKKSYSRKPIYTKSVLLDATNIAHESLPYVFRSLLASNAGRTKLLSIIKDDASLRSYLTIFIVSELAPTDMTTARTLLDIAEGRIRISLRNAKIMISVLGAVTILILVAATIIRILMDAWPGWIWCAVFPGYFAFASLLVAHEKSKDIFTLCSQLNLDGQ